VLVLGPEGLLELGDVVNLVITQKDAKRVRLAAVSHVDGAFVGDPGAFAR